MRVKVDVLALLLWYAGLVAVATLWALLVIALHAPLLVSMVVGICGGADLGIMFSVAFVCTIGMPIYWKAE